MSVLSRLLSRLTGVAPVDFQPLSASSRAQAEERLRRPARPMDAAELASLLDAQRGDFLTAFQQTIDEVRRRCADAEIWQNFYLDLLDEDGPAREEGEGVGADPVEPDEELRRLLAGALVFPAVRSRYAWELGYHTLRFALSRNAPSIVKGAALAAAEDFLLAYDAAQDTEARVNALGDLAAALFLAGESDLARTLCDFSAATLSAEESVRQELHRLRREGVSFVRESFGVPPP